MDKLLESYISSIFSRQINRSLEPGHDEGSQNYYSSFCMHWYQAYDIIAKVQPSYLQDDVVADVVYHLEQMASLLALEAKAYELGSETTESCLEYLLSENLLNMLYDWGICTGKYEKVFEQIQLKLYGILASHHGIQIIAAEPFLRPLLKLLSGFKAELINLLPNSGNASQLVTVLNQLCVALMQNTSFVDLFFLTNHASNGSQAEFIIVRLLLSSVHLEGATGAAARDGLLLCAKMSARSSLLARYMLQGNMCPVLAKCVSDFYFQLPRTLPYKTYRISRNDVKEVNKLTLFIDSLELCNSVAEVAHPSIRTHIQDLLYHGFLVPVMGPALLQVYGGAYEQVASTAYLELLLRCVSEKGLLRSVLHFLFVYEYDGVRVIDVLLRSLEEDSQLSFISLTLMETLVSLNCEDVMIELVYKYLLPGHHLSSQNNITNPQTYRDAAAAFLNLSPDCCSRPLANTMQWVEELASSGTRVLEFSENVRKSDDIAMNNLIGDAGLNYGNLNETLLGNYHAYLRDARYEITSRTIACANWTSKYDTVLKRETNKETKEIDPYHTKEQDSLISICTSEYGTTSITSEKGTHILTSLNDEGEVNNDVKHIDSEVKINNSLISIGDTSYLENLCKNCDGSDYVEEMFRKRLDEVDEMFRKRLGKVEEVSECNKDAAVGIWNAEIVIGPLLTSLLKKVENFHHSKMTVNNRVTSVICKLVSLPTPLLTSLLTSDMQNVPSLYQKLSKLKDEADDLTNKIDNWDELVDKARVFLMEREAALVTARAPLNDNCPAASRDAQPLQAEEPAWRNSSSGFSFAKIARRLSALPSQPPTQISPPAAQKRPIFTQESYWSQSVTHRTVLNAVLLDEWLKELAALCEEHALKLAGECHEDDSINLGLVTELCRTKFI